VNHRRVCPYLPFACLLAIFALSLGVTYKKNVDYHPRIFSANGDTKSRAQCGLFGFVLILVKAFCRVRLGSRSY